MVADAMASNRGAWHADEPYAVFPKRGGYATKATLLPAAMHSHFFDLNGSALKGFEVYTQGLLEARWSEIGTARNAKFPLLADRVTAKILNAPWMGSWFRDHTDAHILVILRHPAAQALSSLRQNWQFPVEAYLLRPEALERHFTANQIRRAQEIFATGDRWQIALLDWIVTSAELRCLRGESVVVRRYEDIVRNPEAFTDEVLSERFGFTDRKCMLTSFSRPSHSSRLSTDVGRQSVFRRDVTALLNGWRSHVDADQIRSGQTLLDEFGIASYRIAPEHVPGAPAGELDASQEDRS